MTDLFISHANDDQAVALEVCTRLEAQGLRCWIAPRDVATGTEWDEAILDAIESAPVFLLILSAHANVSHFVKNEVNRAFSQGKRIVAFRVEDVQPSRSLELYLARHHWTDGFPAPIDDKVDRLAAAVTALLPTTASDPTMTVAGGTRASAAVPTRTSAWWRRAVHTASSLRRNAKVAWIITGVAVAVAVVAAAVAIPAALATRNPAGPSEEMRLQIVLPPTSDLTSFALSPDGRNLVYSAAGQLWLRPLASEDARALAGTTGLFGSSGAFWSPDSQSVGFFADNKLKRIDLASGVVRTVADLPGFAGRGGTWSGGTMVFAPSSDGSPLYRVSADGGEATPVTRLDPDHRTHRYPQFLPDGRRFIFFARTTDSQGLYLGSLDSLDTRRLLDSDGSAVFAPPDAVLFGRKGALLAQRFDLADMTPLGNPTSVAGQVAVDLGTPNTSVAGSLAVSASTTGTVAFRARAADQQLVLLDEAGREVGRIGETDRRHIPAARTSPNQSTLAVTRMVGGNTDIWLLEVAENRPRRFTTGVAHHGNAAWSPDGRQIVFASNRKGVLDLYLKSVVTGDETPLLESSRGKNPNDWSPDGRFVLYQDASPTTADDIWAMPLSGDRKPFVVVQTPAMEYGGRFSPNGRWIAFSSPETGRNEVYAQAFPGPAERVRISTNGAGNPFWRADGRELFYQEPSGQVMAVPMAVDGATLRPGTPVAVFRTDHIVLATQVGQRFLATSVTQPASPITIILNWKPRQE